MKKRYILVKQEETKDCGAAALLTIIKIYQGDAPLQKIRDLTNTTILGCNSFDIINAAKELGFDATGVKTNLESLKEIKDPMIAHINQNGYGHYIIIYNINYKKTNLIIGDPAEGIKKISFEEFEKIFTENIILLSPVSKVPIIKPQITILGFLYQILKTYKSDFTFLLILSILITVLTAVGALYFKNILFYINNAQNKVLNISIIFLLINIIKEALAYIKNNTISFINEKIDFNLIKDTISHIFSLPYEFIYQKKSGDIISRINDINSIKEIILEGIPIIFIDSILIITILTIMLKINIPLTLKLLGVIIPIILFTLLFNKTVKKESETLKKGNAIINGELIDNIKNLETIKGTFIEKEKIIDFNENYLNLQKRGIKYLKKHYKLNLIINILLSLISFIIIINGSKTLNYQNIILFFTLYLYLQNPLNNFLNFITKIKEGKIILKRLLEIFEIEKEELNTKDQKLNPDLQISNLNYSYNEYKPILKNINLEIKPGEKVLIKGPSGEGKSTLLKLINRLLKSDPGTIKFNKKNINEYNISSVRKNISYISQNEALFNNTVLYNICLYNKIEEEKINKIIEITKLKDLIENKLESKKFLIEENGFFLSGGEKQRLVIARGLYKAADIYIFDEITKGLNKKIKDDIIKNIFLYLKNKTIIMTTHEQIDYNLFDRIIYIKKGKIIKNERIFNK